jgi:hypothetical protein
LVQTQLHVLLLMTLMPMFWHTWEVEQDARLVDEFCIRGMTITNIGTRTAAATRMMSTNMMTKKAVKDMPQHLRPVDLSG